MPCEGLPAFSFNFARIETQDSQKIDADVIVIGAGAAGLAAARFLARQSLRVIVLETRDRDGGRVWSRPLPHNTVPAQRDDSFAEAALTPAHNLSRPLHLIGEVGL